MATPEETCLSEMLTIFKAAEETQANHQKNSIFFKMLYEKHKFEHFLSALKKIVLCLVLNTEHLKTPQHTHWIAQRILFIGTFCKALKPNKENIDATSEDDEASTEDPLITKFIEFLLIGSEKASDAIRYRSCQLINVVLNTLSGMYLTDALSDNLQKYLLERLEDPKMPIKLQAVLALNRLQDPYDPEDEIIKKFVLLMTHDGLAKVRKLCVEKVALRADVIESVLLRVRDVDLDVRMAAMQKLAKHAHFLKISEKHIILTMGLVDTSQQVNKFFTSTILPLWLECYNNDILALLKSIRLGFEPTDIEKMLNFYKRILNDFYFKVSTKQQILSVLPNDNKERLMSFEDLNWESVSYLRILAEYLKNNDMEDIFDQKLPEAIVLCRYIKDYSMISCEELDTEHFIEKQFIIKQFFLITKLYDYSDPVTRQTFLKLMEFMLQKVDLMVDVTETVVSNLELIYQNVDNRCTFLCELMSEIYCPLDAEEARKIHDENEFQVSKLTVKLNILNEEKEAALRNEDYLEAERIKNEIEATQKELLALKEKEPDPVKRKMDVPTLSKCLDIACASLHKAYIDLPLSMKTFKNEIVQDYQLLINENDIIKCKALRFYSMCAVLDKPTAEFGIHMFATPIIRYQEDDDEFYPQILVVCIKAVVDLLRIYGTKLISEPTHNEDGEDESMNEDNRRIFTGGICLTKIIKGLVDLMEDDVYEVRETAVVGLTKLILSERIKSAPVIARMVLKWCNPETEDEDSSLKQLIGHFLEQVPYMPSSLELLEESFMCTVKSLFNSPETDPLSQVDINNIAKFLLSLSKTSKYGPEIHTNIARSLCIKIRESPTEKNINAQYSKFLLMLDPPESPGSAQEIRTLCDQILKIHIQENRKSMVTLSEYNRDMMIIFLVAIVIVIIILVVLIVAYIFIGYKFLLDELVYNNGTNITTLAPLFKITTTDVSE